MERREKAYVKYRGLFLSHEPGAAVPVADRTTGGAWELVEIIERSNELENRPLYNLRFCASNQFLSVTPDGTFEVRDNGDGPWEQFLGGTFAARGTGNYAFSVLLSTDSGLFFEVQWRA